MAEQLSFDRKKGFIALPVEVLELDLTPGAFRLLVELCRMANEDGFCWPSLAQLGERLGRSRSSVSTYIQDLRDAGLISTQEQKMANGYNYRLKYQLGFWKTWRASISRTAAQKPERSVQHTARILKDKKQIHKNHTCASAASVGLDGLIQRWSKCTKGAHYPDFACAPSQDLVTQTSESLDVKPLRMSADINSSLRALWSGLGVNCPTETIAAQTHIIEKMRPTTAELPSMVEQIERQWAHHWRNPPSSEQFDKLIKPKGSTTAFQRRSLLKTYLRRWEISECGLQNSVVSGSLSANKVGMFTNA